MRIWDLDVNLISLGRFRLDGGAMFGIVPKPIWEKLFEADERNRIELGLNVLLIKDENEEYTLVDSGISYNFSEKEMEIYQIRRRTGDFPIDPKKVSRVILTHLHFDTLASALKEIQCSVRLSTSFRGGSGRLLLIQTRELEQAINLRICFQ